MTIIVDLNETAGNDVGARESRLVQHIALLRKENEALQKQVSSLKKALVKLGLEQE